MPGFATIGSLRELLDRKLFDIGGRPVTVATIAVVITILVVAALFSRFVRIVTHRYLVNKGVAGRQLRSVERLFNYGIMLVAVLVALQTAGIDLSAVLAASAVFAVAIGFGIQGIALNFVCGIVLLVERSIKIEDIIELDGMVCRVMDLGIRATRVRTLFEEDIIVPNSTLILHSVKNLTLHDSLMRIAVTVGVAYGSDIQKVRRVLQTVADEMENTDQNYDPVVNLMDLGASHLEYEVSVWMHDPWNHRRFRSKLRELIYEACVREKIKIAFPQLDVHMNKAA